MTGTTSTAALADLERAFAEAPDSPAAARLAEAYLGQGRVLEALVVAARRVRLHPEDPAARLLLARVHLARGRQAEAQRELDAAARLSPQAAGGLPSRQDPLPDPPLQRGSGEEVGASDRRGRGDETGASDRRRDGGQVSASVLPPSPPGGQGRGGETLVPPPPAPRALDPDAEAGPPRRQLLGTLALALIAAILVGLTLAQALAKAHRAHERDAAMQEAVHGRSAAAAPAR